MQPLICKSVAKHRADIFLTRLGDYRRLKLPETVDALRDSGMAVIAGMLRGLKPGTYHLQVVNAASAHMKPEGGVYFVDVQSGLTFVIWCAGAANAQS